MTKSQHTPTPWKVCETSCLDVRAYNGTLLMKGVMYARDPHPVHADPVAKANAAFIVKAVNEYADLVACLQNLVECGLIKDTTGDHYDEVLELLAKAEAE